MSRHLLSAIALLGIAPAALAEGPGPAASVGQLIGPLSFFALMVGLAALWLRNLSAEAERENRERKERRRREPKSPSVADGIKSIRDRDPGFDSAAFLRRISHAFRVLQRAWNQQDLAPIRPFASDAVYERSSLQLAEMKRNGVRGVMEDLLVQDTTIAHVDLDEHFQTVTVRFQAAAKSYRVDAKGRLVSGHECPQSFVEYWSFVRRPGATTRDTGGLIEGNCPNCGASLHLNQTGICDSCEAKVWSGRYDWMLTEITHASEWRPRAPRDVPGVAPLAERDRAFCLQQLHDRASAIFWRRITAWQAGDVTMLRNVATTDYCRALAEEFAPDPDGTRLIPAEAAVGSVETEGILCEPPLDQALVRINWSSGAEAVLANGKRQPIIRINFRVSFFLLVRKHGAQGDLDDGLSSSHCRGCGAPATASDSAVCEHCGRPLLDEDRDWLLAGVYFQDEPTVQALQSRFREIDRTGTSRTPPNRAPASGRELVAWIVHVMTADDRIEDAELALLPSIAARHNVSESVLAHLVSAAQAGELDLTPPHNAEEACEWLATAVEMAMADGDISPQEKDAMYALGKRLGLGKKKMNGVINGTRKRLRHQQKTAVT
jgi:predicted lipid-binding transport protein (Tim44 family)/uncharacterized tellurite resistance protein B-like protein